MYSQAVREVRIASGPVANAAGAAASAPPRPPAWIGDSGTPAVIALHASRSASARIVSGLASSQPIS